MSNLALTTVVLFLCILAMNATSLGMLLVVVIVAIPCVFHLLHGLYHCECHKDQSHAEQD